MDSNETIEARYLLMAAAHAGMRKALRDQKRKRTEALVALAEAALAKGPGTGWLAADLVRDARYHDNLAQAMSKMISELDLRFD